MLDIIKDSHSCLPSGKVRGNDNSVINTFTTASLFNYDIKNISKYHSIIFIVLAFDLFTVETSHLYGYESDQPLKSLWHYF